MTSGLIKPKRVPLKMLQTVAGLVCLAWLFVPARVQAFALLGPYQDWMQMTNGFGFYGENGGPMNLGEEYRWNVPVLTYAFDQSFISYFGSNGVAAVEKAIQILNDLPPASILALTNFPLNSRAVNYTAGQLQLYDLTSVTLGMLVEQLGLASPTRNVFAIRRYSRAYGFWPDCMQEACWRSWAIPYLILERNFDPETLAPSVWVNEGLYTGSIQDYGVRVEMMVSPVDPVGATFNSVADEWLEAGDFYAGLTRDDVGGLKYLLNTNNINFETLLPDVHGVGSNLNSYVNGAWRPGVEKITFVRQEYDSVLRQAAPITNQFTDIYITNSQIATQQLERVVTHPDFLFTVRDYDTGHFPYWPIVLRKSATNWLNLAATNGDATNAGPGLIRPPGEIAFSRFSCEVDVYENWSTNQVYFRRMGWGTFDGTTNAPIVYPTGAASSPDYFNLVLQTRPTGSWPLFKWRVPVPVGNKATLQLSTNLLNWSSIAAVTNLGVEIFWFDSRVKQTQYYRVVPE
jgi:hypothetical protein